MKIVLSLVLGFLCWTCFAGSAHAQAAASAGPGGAAASVAAPAVVMPVVVQQAVPQVIAAPLVVRQRVGFLASGCGLGSSAVIGGGGVSAAVAVGGGGHRVRGGRTVIRQRVRVR